MMANTSSTIETTPLVKMKPNSPKGHSFFPRHIPPKPRHPNRVYFQFVCSDVGGYPNVVDKNSHIGYFDFDRDAGWLKATGAFHLPRLVWQGAQTISIWKISNVPTKKESLE